MKPMKTKSIKTSLFLLFVLIASVVLGQSKSDRLFDTFRNKPGVTYFAFTKNMQDAFNINMDDDKGNIKGDLHEIRFMSYNPEKGSLSGSEFVRKAKNLLPSAYSQMDLDDDDDDTEIWMLGNKRKASEFHLFIKGREPESFQIIVSFFGDFDIDDAKGVKEIGLNFSTGD